MISLVALNKTNLKVLTPAPFSEELKGKALNLKTCLREFHLLSENDYQTLKGKVGLHHYDVYFGFEALELVIKVLSGLESPVLGETEVLGQFKEQVIPQLNLKPEFSEVTQYILNMVKLVRSKHLLGLGSQTYGSLVRRLLKGEQHVLFIGAGGLAESIIPWVKENKSVMLSVRNIEKYKNKDVFKGLCFNNVSQKLEFDFSLNVVICAPINSSSLKKHLPVNLLKTVIDLREESKEDPLILESVQVIDLEEAFAQLKTQEDLKKKILKGIDEDLKIQIHSKLTKHRPFGWDDLCM